jgi:hypothetical protein
MRSIALDVHRDFREVAIKERGQVRLAGSTSLASSSSSSPSARGTLGSSAAIVQANMKFRRSRARLNCE